MTAKARAGSPRAMNAVRQPYCSTTQAPMLRPMIDEKVGAAVKQLMANERRCGGYRSAISDSDADVVGASLTATSMRARASTTKLPASPQLMVASAHSRQASASRRRRGTRSTRRPAGKPSSAYTAAKARPEIRPSELSPTWNSALIGSNITARICRPTKLSANTAASNSSRPWLRQPTVVDGRVGVALLIAVPRGPAGRGR